MTELVFVDTNVLVYSRDSRVPAKQQRAEEWLGHLWETKRGRLSGQGQELGSVRVLDPFGQRPAELDGPRGPR